MSTTELLIRGTRQISAESEPRGRAPRGRTGTIVIGAFLAVGALVTAFPFLWMVFASVKPRSESVAYPPQLLPQHPTFEYYVQLFAQLDFGRYLLNTLLIVAICTSPPPWRCLAGCC